MDAEGIIDLDSARYELSVIQNENRLTYEKADRIIKTEQPNAESQDIHSILRNLEALTRARGKFRRIFESYDFGASTQDMNSDDLDASETSLLSASLIEELMLLSCSSLSFIYQRTRDSGDSHLDHLSQALQSLLTARKERLKRELEERKRLELERKKLREEAKKAKRELAQKKKGEREEKMRERMEERKKAGGEAEKKVEEEFDHLEVESTGESVASEDGKGEEIQLEIDLAEEKIEKMKKDEVKKREKSLKKKEKKLEDSESERSSDQESQDIGTFFNFEQFNQKLQQNKAMRALNYLQSTLFDYFEVDFRPINRAEADKAFRAVKHSEKVPRSASQPSLPKEQPIDYNRKRDRTQPRYKREIQSGGSLFSQFLDSTKAKNYQHFPYICETFLKQKRDQQLLERQQARRKVLVSKE